MNFYKILSASLLFFGIIIAGFWVFPKGAFAAYPDAGYFISTNLLPAGYTPVINSFTYTVSSIPAGTTLKIQFSRDGNGWYDSTETIWETDTLSEGTHIIDLGDWSPEGSYFYYKIIFTSDGSDTPILDEITVAYTSGDYTYETSGSLTSTNLLSGKTASSIDSFSYTISSLPSATGITAQFSTDGSSWYNSSGTLDGSNTLSQGENTIDLSGLGWDGGSFYYKLSFTSDDSATPVLDETVLTYYYTPTKLKGIELKGIKLK